MIEFQNFLLQNAHILSLLYNILFNSKTPVYLKDRFKYLHLINTRYFRSSDNMRLETPISRTNYYNTSFIVHAVCLWNALPVRIREGQPLQAFNALVMDY